MRFCLRCPFLLEWVLLYIDEILAATAMDKIFEANFSANVKWSKGKRSISIFEEVFASIGKNFCGEGDWALIFARVLSRSTTREATRINHVC